jgi:DNA mismatch endonuclease, patch repair protein
MPVASSEAVRRQMSDQRRRNTACELSLRSAIHGLGLRYYVHRRPLPGVRREADVIFPRSKVAVFVDGCFWHACPVHASWPKANSEWWRNKIVRNQERDRDTDQRLANAGWKVIRVWEHEEPGVAARRIRTAVLGRRKAAVRGSARA